MYAHIKRNLFLSIIISLLLGVGAAFAQTNYPITVPSGVPTSGEAEVNLEIPTTRLTVTGCASPNALVTFFDNDAPVGTVVASSVGRFSKTIISETDGIHNLRAYFDDVNGRSSSVITRNISLTAHSNTTLELLLPSTIEHSPEPIPVGEYLVFRGSTCPYSIVNVIINNNFTLAAQADNNGNWYVIADTEDFYSGKYSYEVLSSLGSLTSQKSQKHIFTTFGGLIPGSQDPGTLSPPTITEPGTGYLSSTRAVTVRGNGPTSTQIEIFVDNKLTGSIFTNSIGEWSFILTMAESSQTVAVRSCIKGGCSELSKSITIYFSGDLSACSLNFNLSNYRFFGLEENEGVNLGLNIDDGSPRYEILIDWGDASVEKVTKLDNDFVRYHHVYKHIGQYNGVVTIEDSRGCIQYQYFSASVGPGESIPWIYLLFIPLGGILSWLVSQYVTVRRLRIKLPEPKPMLPPIQHFPKPAMGAGKKPDKEESSED